MLDTAEKNKLKPDTILKNFWRDNRHFADLFNAVFFNGEQVLKPQDLTEADTDVSSMLKFNGHAETIQKILDVVKKTAYGVDFVLWGLENQAKIHYAMPLRHMVGDAFSYMKEYDEIVHIPMSSGLSSTCETAIMLSKDYDGKVEVVNNQRISVTQKTSVLDAVRLAKAGKSALEIKESLEAEKLEASIYITVDTLKYLKKGGRITPAAAAIGTVLNLKPVLQIQGEKLDAFAKVRGWKQAKKTMLDAMEKDLLHRFGGKKMSLLAAYTCSAEEAKSWKEELEDRFPNYTIDMDPLSLSVACHIGPGALAVACAKEVDL